MVHKCANPQCRAEFRYASQGHLFPFELRSPIGPCKDVPESICQRKPDHATVCFWLCDECCLRFTLRFSAVNGLQLKEITRGPACPESKAQNYHSGVIQPTEAVGELLPHNAPGASGPWN